jgi:hypothetical protein
MSVEIGSTAAVAARLRAAVEFINDDPKQFPLRIIPICSRDECDQGGPLIPISGDSKGADPEVIAPVLQASR